MTAPDDTTTTTTVCVLIDPYGFPVPCDQIDPCLDDGSQTMWTFFECLPHNPPMSVFCADYPTHPFCIGRPPDTTTTTTVEVGPPPTLPPTGTNDDSVIIPAAGLVLLTGGILIAIEYWWRRRG